MARFRAAAIVLMGAIAAFAMLPVARAAAAGPGLPVSDDFTSPPLNTSLWSVQNSGGGSVAAVSGGALNLTVPSGGQHDLFPGTEGALQVVQPIANRDFQVETQFNTLGAPTANTGNFQDEGIVVQQNPTTFLRFDVFSDGTAIHVFSASVSGATATQHADQIIGSPTAPIRLRVQRSGATWFFTYSEDSGSTWVSAGHFDDRISATAVGLYAGDSSNPTSVPTEGWTAHAEYFHSIVSSPSAVVADNFNGTVDPAWSFVNPAPADATQSTDISHALINVPGGASHDPNAIGASVADGAPRLVQSVSNTDFSFDAKFDSQVTAQFQEQGVVAEQDAANYLHAEIQQNYFQTDLVVNSVSGSTITTVATVEIYNQPSITLRLTRQGDLFSVGYSYDGTHWTAGASFLQTLAVAKVGVFGGNFGGTSSPGFVARVDSVLNTPTSTTPPAINVWYGANQTFGANGQPQRWVNILGDVSDVTGTDTLTYTLNGGEAVGLSMGENPARLVAPGEFNAEIDYASLNPGANTVTFTAIDNNGNTSTATVTVNKVTGKSWPLPYTATWTPTGGNVNGIAQIADGHWAIQSDGTIRNSDIGYDRLLAIGQASTWSQYIVTAQVKINSKDPDGSAVGLIAGFQGATNDLHGMVTTDQPRVGHPFPAAFLYDSNAAVNTPEQADIYANTDAHQEQSLVSSPMHLTLGVTYTFKARVTDNALGGSLFQFKVWQTGTTEPSPWLVQANGDLSRGSVVLAAHRADVSFGTVSVVGLPGAPTITSVARRNAGATLTFSAPANNGGSTITRYNARCTSSNGGATGTATGTTSPMTVVGLTNTRTYRCTVTATNAVGTGSVSFASGAVVPSSTAPPPNAGYWMLDSGGIVYPFGNAVFFGDAANGSVAMASRLVGGGYWTTDAFGDVRGFGASHADAGRPTLRAGELVSTISGTPSGGGYWLFTTQGRAFAHGDAHSYADMGNVHLNGPIVASTATPTGHGYYMVGSDGGVFSFGDARFHGSTGRLRLNKPIVGLAPTPDNRGYWLAASDGGVFAFGAPFRGSLGAVKLNQPVNGIIAYGNGYLMVASDGGVFDFSNKAFAGSLGGRAPGFPPVVAIVSS